MPGLTETSDRRIHPKEPNCFDRLDFKAFFGMDPGSEAGVTRVLDGRAVKRVKRGHTLQFLVR